MPDLRQQVLAVARTDRRAPRLTRAIVAAAVLAVLAAAATFAIHAEASRRTHARQASHMVAMLGALLAEQAGRLFDVAQAMADEARTATAGRHWDEIERRADLQAAMTARVGDYVTALWLMDERGTARLTSRAFPAPQVGMAEQEYFRLHKNERLAGTLVSPVAPSPIAAERVMMVSLRIEDDRGNFRGVAAVALDPRHFLKLYDSIHVDYPVTIDLVRDDGVVLIRSSARDFFGPAPASDIAGRPPPAERFDAGVAPAIDATGTTVLQGLKRVRGFPAYAAVSVAEKDITARWLDELRFHALLAGLALLAILMALAAVRHFALREAQALGALGIENAMLEQRVHERSRAIERMIVEVKHRVKNSLQLAASLLYLQRGRVDASMREPLGVAHARILAIAGVHQQLHQAGGFDTIDLDFYLATVAREVARTVAAPDRRVDLATEIEPMPARIEVAMPLGLIVAESVSNAIRHARAGTPAQVRVTLTGGPHGACLVVRDRGGGLPAGTTPGLGTQLLRGLAGQIGSEFEMRNDGDGTLVVVTLPRLMPASRSGEAGSRPA